MIGIFNMQSLLLIGLAVLLAPVLAAATLGLFAAACFWSLLACLAIIFMSPTLLLIATIAASIWLTRTAVQWSTGLFAKVPVGSGNEGNQVLMKPEAEANGNEAHAKLEVNLVKVGETRDA